MASTKTRRPRGTGTIRRKGNYWAAAWFTIDAATGERHQHSKSGFASPDDAQGFLTEQLADVRRGTYTPDARLTVRQLLEDYWLPIKGSENLSANTISQYEYGASLVADTIGALRFEGTGTGLVTPAQAAKMVRVLRSPVAEGGRGLSARTVQLAVLVLKSATNWALHERLIPVNPLARFKQPRLDRSGAVRSWDRDEARAFLTSVADDRLEAVWALFVTRGLRRGEIAGLKWGAVDLEAATLQVRETLVVTDGKALTSEPKSKRGFRRIPIDVRLIKKLGALRQRQEIERAKAGDAYEDRGYVLADELGRPWYPNRISETFDRLVADAGLRRITVHGARHTAATLMLKDGVPVKVVADILGDSVQVVLSYYAHVLKGMSEDAGERLSASLLD